MHGALRGEHPAQGLLDRAALLRLGIEQGLLLRRRAEPRRDREPVALGRGGRGRGVERPNEAGIEALRRRRRCRRWGHQNGRRGRPGPRSKATTHGMPRAIAAMVTNAPVSGHDCILGVRQAPHIGRTFASLLRRKEEPAAAGSPPSGESGVGILGPRDVPLRGNCHTPPGTLSLARACASCPVRGLSLLASPRLVSAVYPDTYVLAGLWSGAAIALKRVAPVPLLVVTAIAYPLLYDPGLQTEFHLLPVLIAGYGATSGRRLQSAGAWLLAAVAVLSLTMAGPPAIQSDLLAQILVNEFATAECGVPRRPGARAATDGRDAGRTEPELDKLRGVAARPDGRRRTDPDRPRAPRRRWPITSPR